jgi:hypothetical protein
VAELADAADSKSAYESNVGSTPTPGTNKQRNRHLLAVLTIVALLSVGFIRWKKHSMPGSGPQQRSLTDMDQHSQAVANLSPLRSDSGSPNRIVPLMLPNPKAFEKLANFEASWDLANSRSLDLYGKVVDQNDSRVGSASVMRNIMTTIGFEGTTENVRVTQSDSEGNFEFVGLYGQRIGLVVEKSGYRFTRRKNGSWTMGYRADSTNRIILKLWKVGEKGVLVKGTKLFGLSPNGQTYTIDLIAGLKKENTTDGGDFLVQASRSRSIQAGHKFDWSLVITAKGGGVMENNDIYPNEAPADGYRSAYTIMMSANDPTWSREGARSLYLASRNGQLYGVINIHIISNYGVMAALDVQYVANPTGSRNLETD